MGPFVAAPAQPASSVDTQRRLALEFVAPVALAEEPGGSSPRGMTEEPGGSSGSSAHVSCALCRGAFLELQLQDRMIRSQRLR
eukprot:1639070-Amphidinium_carterae.1